MSFALVVAKGSERGRRYRFQGAIGVGRDAANDLVLNQAAVSRMHARIERQGEGWALLDRGSANGTELNGALVRSAVKLRPGDRIGVGGTLFEFRTDRWARIECAWRFPPAPARATAMAAAVLLFGIAVERATRLTGAESGGGPSVAMGDRAASISAGLPLLAPPEAAAGLEGARAAYQRGRRKLEERRVAPGNLYEAWQAFMAARGYLQGLARPPAFSADLGRLIGETQRDLERECRRLLFAASRFDRYGEEEKAQRIWREILLHFPGDDPAGCRSKARDNLLSPQPDDGGG
jgi:hypothetical protein